MQTDTPEDVRQWLVEEAKIVLVLLHFFLIFSIVFCFVCCVLFSKEFRVCRYPRKAWLFLVG